MNGSKDPSTAIATIEKENIRWLQIQFHDLLGRLRSVSFPAEHFLVPEKWTAPITFDASSCGMASIQSSDMLLHPDPDTLLVYPWTDPAKRTARVLANVINRDGSPSPMDSRKLAQKLDVRSKSEGFSSVRIGPEMEFYLFHNMREAMVENDLWHKGVKKGIGTTRLLPDILEEYGMAKYPPRATSAYFLPESKDSTVAYRDHLCEILEDMGIDIKYHHHEGGSRQVEVEFDYLDSVTSAGEVISLLKHASRVIARDYGVLPTFMPKPLTGDLGSGMHIHIELFKDNVSSFYDPATKELSQTGRYFVGGVLERLREMALIMNPIVNSYRRLVPGFEAPRYAVWAYSNRSSLVRVPPAKGGKMDIEIRNGDAAANPYLLPSFILAAGLEGIKKKTDPGDPVEEDVDKLSPREISSRGISQLPMTLGEAIEEADCGTFMRDILGKETAELLIEYKRNEWQGYLGYATPWEIFHYFDV